MNMAETKHNNEQIDLLLKESLKEKQKPDEIVKISEGLKPEDCVLFCEHNRSLAPNSRYRGTVRGVTIDEQGLAISIEVEDEHRIYSSSPHGRNYWGWMPTESFTKIYRANELRALKKVEMLDLSQATIDTAIPTIT
jgi:hypothetical protein